MCGVFGFFGAPAHMPSALNAAAALATLAHRGPDARGLVWRPELGLVLGHARLSIIDPISRSDQPFEIGDNVLVFNGEIYNYRRLRDELQRLGAEFRTRGDTEVILVGYRYWGRSVFERLRGMYAFALYDHRDRCLHLVRDEFGIKPLCFLQGCDEVVFGSEIKAIAALRSLSLDGGVLVDMLSWGFQMENASLYAGVRYLAPGSVLTLRRDERGALSQTECEIWPARRAYQQVGPEPTADALRATIAASVGDHMIADVPLAVALSGGLDSSIVAAAAARHHPGLMAFTFTLAPGGADPDVEHAALLCRHLGLEHRIARLMPGDTAGWLRRVAWHLEEPVANVNSLLSYGLGAIVRSHGFKVVLVGEGADELFAGYPWYRFALDRSLSGSPETVFDAYRKRRAQSGCTHFLRGSMLEVAAQRLTAQREVFRATISDSPLNGFLSFDQETQLQYSQLLRVDRMFMAHGVEARVPFLYRSVLEASAALPATRMLRSANGVGRMEKVALAEAFADVLPERIIARPKFGEQGTVNIWSSWLARGVSGEFERCLQGSEMREARQLLDQFIDWHAVARERLAPKEKFAIALLLEAVHNLMISRQRPDTALPVQWEMLG
ncbi:MAG: asparagine synthase (glutamine-hydrolyzing) [Burkholderiales bacterium]